MKLRQKISTTGSKDAPPSLGAARLDSILNVARTILIRDGYANFSMRKVAKEAGISLGHLQHFLPSKESLLEALFEHASNLYDRQYQELVDKLPRDPEKRFVAIIDYLLKDTTNPETKTFFFEFWAIAARNPHAKIIVDRMHAHHRETLASFISEMNPAISADQRIYRATQIAAIIDGLLVHISDAKARQRQQAEILKDIRAHILNLAAAP